VASPTPSGTPSGTAVHLLGQYHSMHELYDLAKALAYQVDQINLAQQCAHKKQWDGYFDTTINQWISPNADVNTWLANWNAANANFAAVLDRANEAMNTPTLVETIVGGAITSWSLWDVTPATDSQGNVFDALAIAFDPFMDLDRALRAPSLGFPKECLPTYPNMPKATAPDFSLDAYKITSMIRETIHEAAKEAGSWLDNPGVQLALVAVSVAAGAVIVTQVMSVFPKAAGR